MITAPRGTADLLPPRSRRRHALEARLRRVAEAFGYGEVRTPMFEATELFVRGVGEATDVVEKEMYTFLDKGGRSMTLRPEWTAPVVRALIEGRLLQGDPRRLFYVGPFFRYERPQAGRLRQAHQFGVELYGAPQPAADAEVILLALEAVRAAGVVDAVLKLNSIGDPLCRAAYRERLVAHFRPHVEALSEDSRRRLERNPLRILDSKAEADRPFVETAPTLEAALCGPCREHFAAVRAALDAAGAAYVVDPRLVRGFDYYTRTVFEIASGSLGAQSALAGGGRYDGLVEALGGPPTAAVGFGMGIERLELALGEDAAADAPRAGVQVVALGEAARGRLDALVPALRRASLARDPAPPILVDYGERKVLAQYKLADRNGARVALVAGDDELAAGEIALRDLVARHEERLPWGDPAATVAAIFDRYDARMKVNP